MKFAGFISYSHSDGTDLTRELYSYLENQLSNFKPIYDQDVPEGEKLEEIKEKLSVCHILIIIITPAALSSKAVAEEIQIAKEKGMKIIPCKNSYVRESWKELPWEISEYKGFDFENKDELKRMLAYSLSKTLDELEQELTPGSNL